MEQLMASDRRWLEQITVVIPYCTIGYRSAKFTQSLIEKEPKLLVKNMRGSILLWTHAGGTLTLPHTSSNSSEHRGEHEHDVGSHQVPTTRLHVYGAAWDLAPACFTTVRFD